MTSHEYHFITHWRVEGTVDEVAAILGDAPALPRWWPSVYLRVQELRPGDEHGIGKVVGLHTKGWLPYTLRWDFYVSDVRPDGFALEAWGDFVGRGVWTWEQDGPYVNITYDWKISAEKPLLKYLSPVLKPFFAANHRWAMAKGEESLKLELARHRARSAAERARVPPPPPATSPVPFLLGAAALIIFLYYWLGGRRAERKS